MIIKIFIMNFPDYERLAGTLMGEIPNEVYSKFGENTHHSTHYGWHTENIDDYNQIIYSLVNSPEGVKFLIAKVLYDKKDITPKDHITKEPVFLVPVLVPDYDKPIRLEFIWRDAGIPFITKREADDQGLAYSL